jgi:hypothetical protein
MHLKKITILLLLIGALSTHAQTPVSVPISQRSYVDLELRHEDLQWQIYRAFDLVLMSRLIAEDSAICAELGHRDEATINELTASLKALTAQQNAFTLASYHRAYHRACHRSFWRAIRLYRRPAWCGP